jgi:hypothetical protein
MAEVIWWDGRRSIIDAIRRTAGLTGVERVVEVTRLVSPTASAASRCDGSSRPIRRVPFGC